MLSNSVGLLTPAYDIDTPGSPDCGTGVEMILMAQSVPSASSVPCLASLPTGWELGGMRIRRGDVSFSLDSDVGGNDAVQVTLQPPDECDDHRAPPRCRATRWGCAASSASTQLPPQLRSVRTYVFEGGCVTYQFALDAERSASLLFDADAALAMQPRGPLVEKVRDETAASGCAASARPPARVANEGAVSHPFAGTLVALGLWIVMAVLTVAGTTMLALRLLGIRRGWARAALAGLIGWSTGLLLALAVADWDWGTDGLVLHVLAFSIPATMAVAVAFDLLAQPGTLATGERAGLVVTPRPFRAVRLKVSVLLRYRELLRLARKEGLAPSLAGRGAAPAPTDPVGVRLRRALEEAGGVYVKLGQIAATRVDLLPAEICEELGQLQNRVAPEPAEQHAGRARGGVRPAGRGDVRRVRLGADRRGVDRSDLRARSSTRARRSWSRSSGRASTTSSSATWPRCRCSPSSRSAGRRSARASGPVRCSASSRESLRAELDFLREVEAMAEMAALLGERLLGPGAAGAPAAVHPAGARPGALRGQHAGRRRPARRAWRSTAMRVAEQLLRTTLEQVLRMGFFHADPHPGNVFVFEDGSLGLIDFGAVGRLDPIQQPAVLEMLVAHGRGATSSLLRDAIERVVEVDETAPRERLERALARLLAAERPGHRDGRAHRLPGPDPPAGRVRAAPAGRPGAAVARARDRRRHPPGPRPRGLDGVGRRRDDGARTAASPLVDRDAMLRRGARSGRCPTCGGCPTGSTGS